MVPALALDQPMSGWPGSGGYAGPVVEIHGFVSEGAFVSTANNFIGHSKRGSFEFFEAGLNVSTEVADRLRFGLQLFARDFGSVGNYVPRVDWAFLDYRFREWLGFRAGRVKLPLGLFNEFSDIDSARAQILLPQSMYPTENRDYLLAATGVGLYGTLPVGPVGALDYQFVLGTIYIAVNDAIRTNQIATIDTRYAVASQLFWRPPITGLRLGASWVALDVAFNFQYDAATLAAGKAAGVLPADFDGNAYYRLNDINLMVGSLEYVFGSWLFAAEYARWKGTVKTRPALAVAAPDDERLYGMVTYRFTPWLEVGTYYALRFVDVKDRDGDNLKRFTVEHRAYQHDATLSLRFDVNDHWLFKLEAHYLVGTAMLAPADNPDLTKLDKTWGLFLAKTTLSF